MEVLFQSALFLKALKNPNKAISPEPITFDYTDRKIAADLYRPQHQTSKGLILFVHGMTPFGYRDERMMSLGRAAAKIGYTAVIPSFLSIKQGLIETASIEELIACVQSLVADEALCPSQSLAVFTASFSGAICIRAVAHESIRDHITSLLIIGGCNYPAKCFESIMHLPNQDPYAMLVLLKNLASEKIAADHVLERALSCAIEDAYANSNRHDSYKNYLSYLSKEDRERVTDFIDPVLSHKINPMVVYEKQVKALDADFMRWSDIAGIRCCVALFHSTHDHVISPLESRQLFQELKSNGIEARLLITPLLEHAGLSFRFGLIRQFWRLLKTFNYFFDAIEQRR